MSLQITHVAETAFSTGTVIWEGGSKVLLLAVLQLSSDAVEVYIRNGDAEVMSFNLNSLRSNYKLDESASMLPVYMYAINRWVLDFRSFKGLPPSGTTGIEIGVRATSGTKTLNNAMVMWRNR